VNACIDNNKIIYIKGSGSCDVLTTTTSGTIINRFFKKRLYYKCSLNEIHEKKSNCNGLNGKVVKIQLKVSICLTNEKFIEINNANSGNYVVKGASSQFGITNSEYAIINVKW